MVKTSRGASSAPASPSPTVNPNAGAPGADPSSYWQAPTAENIEGAAKDAFNAVLDRAGVTNGHAPAAEEHTAEGDEEREEVAESADDDDPKVARARKFLERRGYDAELLASKDAEWIMERKQRLTQRESDRDAMVGAMRQELTELRRAGGQQREDRTNDDDDARRAPARPSFDFSSELATVREQFGEDAAKAFGSMAKKMSDGAGKASAELLNRFTALEQRVAKRDEAETRRAVASVIDDIAEEFPDLEDDPGLRADVEEAMGYLAPRYEALAKAKGSQAAMRELASAAARSCGLEREDSDSDEKEDAGGKRRTKPQRAIVTDRRASPKPMTGDRARRKIFDYVMDHHGRDPNVVDNAMRSAGLSTKRQFLR